MSAQSSYYSNPKGITASVTSSVLFGVVYFVTPMLHPLDGFMVWATRIVVAVPFTLLVLVLMRQLPSFIEIFERIKKRPTLLVGLATSGILLSAQLWLFGWAPLNGRGLQVALGYFLLPLVLVIVGRFLYRDRLSWWHWLAAAIAAVGVLAQLINVGGVSWETLLVCLGYPLYFILRRKIGTASTGGMLWEFMLVSPIAITIFVHNLTRSDAFVTTPHLVWFTPAFGVLAAVALWLYVLASRYLPLSLFGLLSYLEPALLIVASLLLGERIAAAEFFTYGAIWLAVLVLITGAVVTIFNSRRL